MATTFDTYNCPSPTCTTNELLVRTVPGRRDVWHVTTHPEVNGWTIAALDPCCPFCGTTLIQEINVVLIEMESIEVAS